MIKYQAKQKINWAKETDIAKHTCYYLDDIIKFADFYLHNILIEEKSYENILVYNISYKTLFSSKPLRNRFDKVDEFTTVYDGNKYLVLFGGEKVWFNLQQS